MEVAVDSPANIEPPPLLFGRESPNASRQPLSTSQSPIPISTEVHMDETLEDSRPTEAVSSEPEPNSQTAEAPSEAAAVEVASNDPMDTTPNNTRPSEQAAEQAATQTPQEPNPPSEAPNELPTIPTPEQPSPDTSTEQVESTETMEDAQESRNNELSPELNGTETQLAAPTETNEAGEGSGPTDTPSTPTPEAEMSDPPSNPSEEGQNTENPSDSTPPPPPPPPPEEEPAPWADIIDDTSAPDEEEQKEIDGNATEESDATNHKHFEESFFTPLDDPDYVPIEKTRISWTMKGVRGTKEKPNRDLIIKSPPAFVGGHYWSFKFFPRGNNNSDLSIYIDCSNERPKETTKSIRTLTFKVVKGPADADLDTLEPDVNIVAPPEEAVSTEKSELPSKDEEMKDDSSEEPKKDEAEVQPEPEKTETANEGSQESSSEDPAVVQDEVKTKKEWRVSAQIGLVCYNADEPRTCYHQTSYHMFTGENSDWGWTRFHGPWEAIHKRRRGQRKPLMQNDTLSFDAYIRIIKDDTKSLWWHSSDGESNWPAMTLHGIRGLGGPDNGTTPLVSAIMPWLMLAPFRKLMYSVKVPTGPRFDDAPKNLCGALRKIIYLLKHQKTDYNFHYVDIGAHGLAPAMSGYAESSSDVVSCWESLRRILEIELKGTDGIAALAEIFDGRLDGDRLTFEREPTLISNKNWISAGKQPTLRVPAEGMKDIQEALEKTFGEKSGPWALPKLLQVELDRQKFDKQARKWSKIMDKVTLNEEIDLSKWTLHPEQGRYSLYGFIVHQGERTSGRFYSVLRPAGPGGKWYSFQETTENRIACLTKKMVLAAAEGPGPESVKATKPPGDCAYIALYVRSDATSEYLQESLETWEPPSQLKQGLMEYLPDGSVVPEDKEDYSRVTCEIYHSDIFKQRSDRGVFNAWDPELKNKNPEKVLTMEFPSSIKLSEIRWKLYKLLGLENVQQVRIWPMLRIPPTAYSKNFNPVLDGVYLDSPLSIWHQTKLRWWVHILPMTDVPILGIMDPPIPVPIPDPEPAVEEPPTEPPTEPTPEVSPADVVEDGTTLPSGLGEVPEPGDARTGEAEVAGGTEAATEPPVEPAEAPVDSRTPPVQIEVTMADAPAQRDEAANPENNETAVERNAATSEPQAEPATTTAEPTREEANSAQDTTEAQQDMEAVTETPVPAPEAELDVESSQGANTPATSVAEETMPDAPNAVEQAVPAQGLESSTETVTPILEPSAQDLTESPLAVEDSPPADGETVMDTTEDSPLTSPAPLVDASTDSGSPDQPMDMSPPSEETPANVESSEQPVDVQPPAQEAISEGDVPTEPAAVEDEDADIQEAMRRSLADAEAQQAATADTEMQDTQPSSTEESNTTENPPAEPAAPELDNQLIKQNGVYVFVQKFDPFKQKLTSIGSFVAKGDENIKETVRKYLEMPKEQEFLVWETSDSYTTKSINTGQTFYDAELGDGTILIVRDSIKPKDTAALEAKGDFHNPQEHLRYLAALSRQHPIHSKTHPSITLSTYGTAHYTGSMKRGHYHGTGTLISDTAEVYKGPFVLGERSGAEGHLVTASGDTYDGAFLAGQRHGEGTFVEHKTGNRYVGGWKDDKRHGRGTTYWEVADEEMNTCQICYGAEQDALFYECGHVCACTTCAKQVEVCPICRATVKSVVKIYRT